MDNLKGSKLDKTYTTGEFFTVRIDADSKKMLKLVFIKLLNQIGSAVQAEQAFCQEFFSTKTSQSNSENSSVRQQSNLSISNGTIQRSDSQPLARYPSDTSLTSTSTNNSKQILDSKAEL